MAGSAGSGGGGTPPREEELDVVVQAADLMVDRLEIPAVEVYEKLERVARTAGIPLPEAARRLAEVLRHQPAVV